jgi:hypothetical protein
MKMKRATILNEQDFSKNLALLKSKISKLAAEIAYIQGNMRPNNTK